VTRALLVVAGDRAMTRFVAETLLARKLDRTSPTLRSSQWALGRAHSGLEGLLMLTRSEQRWDAVLVDQSLPDRELMQFLEQLRKTPEGRHLPVYVMSERGRDQLTRKQASEAYGVAGFIDKPVTADSIRRGLRSLERMRTVLLVEPSAEVADPLASELRAGLFMVEVARTARAALQIVGEQRPDAVVIALDLPDDDAASLCAQIKRNAQSGGLPVFLYGTVEQLEAVDIPENAHRADDFLRAPLAGAGLVDRIRAQVGHSTATSLPAPPPGAPGHGLPRSSIDVAGTQPLEATSGSERSVEGRGLGGKATVSDTALPSLLARDERSSPPRHEWEGKLNSTQRDLSVVRSDAGRPDAGRPPESAKAEPIRVDADRDADAGGRGGAGRGAARAEAAGREDARGAASPSSVPHAASDDAPGATDPRASVWLAGPSSPPTSASPATDRPSAKRSQRRVPCNLSVSFRDGGETIYRSTSLNISNGGILIATEHPLELGTHIDLSLELPTRTAPILARGKVAWIQPAPTGSAAGVGIKFSKIDAQDLRAIVDYVNRVSKAVYVAP
jgi:uncharacterized protein (TIGR02266 family)